MELEISLHQTVRLFSLWWTPKAAELTLASAHKLARFGPITLMSSYRSDKEKEYTYALDVIPVTHGAGNFNY